MNLLFIMTDQQRFDTLQANGNANMKTPALDQLAAEGANVQGYFTNCPVCVPSRCTLFTGRYPHSHGVRENYCLLEAGREIHLFRALKQAGYRIGYTGKNHLIDEQETKNFDFWRVVEHDDTPEGAELIRRYWEQRKHIPGGVADSSWRSGWVHDSPPETTRTGMTGQAGIEFIEQQNGNHPFALCVSFEEPHVPHLCMREYFDQYPLDEIDLLPDPGDEGLAERAKRWLIKKGAQIAGDATEADKKRYVAVYRAMISAIDTQIGRLLTSLEQKGFSEDTLVVFTSDHGDFNFQYGLAKKDLVLVDALLHVPCLFKLPNIIPPKIFPADVLAEEVDILPTILELLGIDEPFGIQGKSFAPLLRGETETHKTEVYAEIAMPWLYCPYPDFDAYAEDNGGRGKTPFNVPGDYCKAIRTVDWRYIWYGKGEEELYHLAEDPFELKNLANVPAHAATKADLKLRLLEWLALTEDPLDANAHRDLQQHYSNWSPLSIQPGKHEHPPWKALRFSGVFR